MQYNLRQALVVMLLAIPLVKANSNKTTLGDCLKTRGFYVKEEHGPNFSICQEFFDYVRATLPAGSTILELGSGWASGEFSKYYKVYSIEHNPKWLNKFNTNYIYAPLKNGWYDIDVLRKSLPKEYDLLIVDGPAPGAKIRIPFIDHLDLFNLEVPIIIDDSERPGEKLIVEKLNSLLKERKILKKECEGKEFTVFLPKSTK